jgi:outer membrane receptor protein involved in Fe transport
LEAALAGFAARSARVDVPAGAATTLDVTLEPARLERTLVVTAVGAARPLFDTPHSVSVVTSEAIASSPAANNRDVHFASRTPASTLAIGERSLLDGRTLYHEFFNFTSWDTLPVALDELRKVEVFRGPGSSLWGANAIYGVVNIETKGPREMPGGEAWLSGGEQGTYAVGARWAQAFERWSYKVSGSYYRQGPWERDEELPDGSPLPDDARFPNPAVEQPKLDVRADYEPDPSTRLTLKAGTAGANGVTHTGVGPWITTPGSYASYAQARFVAASRRTSSRSGLRPPRGSTVRSSRKRSSLAWAEASRSPISSKKTVPPSAVSSLPVRRSTPVATPFSTPNSSASTRVPGRAGQLTTTKGPSRRRERRWMSWATSSLPVPVSPLMRTVTSVAATFSMSALRARRPGDPPTRSGSAVIAPPRDDQGSRSSA